MEVVCLILGRTLTSCVSTIPACVLGFDIPTSLIFIENAFYYYSCYCLNSVRKNIFTGTKFNQCIDIILNVHECNSRLSHNTTPNTSWKSFNKFLFPIAQCEGEKIEVVWFVKMIILAFSC